jgi:hypothetical protein
MPAAATAIVPAFSKSYILLTGPPPNDNNDGNHSDHSLVDIMAAGFSVILFSLRFPKWQTNPSKS